MPSKALAITSIVLGGISFLFGIVSVFEVLSYSITIFGIAFSSFALYKINSTPAKHSGKGFAVSGLVLSGIGLVTAIMFNILIRLLLDYVGAL